MPEPTKVRTKSAHEVGPLLQSELVDATPAQTGRTEEAPLTEDTTVPVLGRHVRVKLGAIVGIVLGAAVSAGVAVATARQLLERLNSVEAELGEAKKSLGTTREELARLSGVVLGASTRTAGSSNPPAQASSVAQEGAGSP